MSGGAHVVVEVDPASSSALVRVSGTASSALADELARVLRRVEETVGPRMRVDLSGCDAVDPAVVALLRLERDRLRRAGGSLWSRDPLLDGSVSEASLDGGRPAGSTTSLQQRLSAAVRRRASATDVGPERTAAGRELLEVLRLLRPVHEEQQPG